MHNFNFYDGETKVDIHHNSDLSGEVVIALTYNSGGTGSLRVPARALIEFVAEHIRSNRIAEIENLSCDEIVGTIK